MSDIPAETPRMLRHEAQRLEILEAAAAAIAEHGYHGMTMRGLASATGRGLATFYNYFSSKEDVLFSLQSDAFETMTDSVTGVLEGIGDPIQRLYGFVLNHLSYSAEHKSVMRVLVHEASALPPGRRKTVRLLKEGYFKICRDIVASILAARCESAGQAAAASVDHAEVERITYSVFGMLNWSYGWYDPRRHGSPEDVARSIHALAVYGLTRCPHCIAQETLTRRSGAVFSLRPAVARGRDRTAIGKRRSVSEVSAKRTDARRIQRQETV